MLLFVIAFAAAQEPANTDKAKKIIGSHYEAVLIPAGSFSMGCTSEQAKCDGDEKPAHQVTLTRPYFMMTHEVTEELYKSLVKKDLVISRGAAFPAESITWFDAVRFANALSRLEKRGACYDIGDGENPKVTLKSLDCGGWRLPTEAEWEWAARGAQDAKYQYSGSDVLADVGWYVEFGRNVLIELRPVCKLQRNELGLCDMSGNTWE
jgi:formylglycine-generating enzyme required for sulfatase activity